MYRVRNVSGPQTGTKRVLPMINGKRLKPGEEIVLESIKALQHFINSGQLSVSKVKASKKAGEKSSEKASEPEKAEESEKAPGESGESAEGSAVPENDENPKAQASSSPAARKRGRKKQHAPSHTEEETAPSGESQKGPASSGGK